ncbi:hypothetical protein [Aquimarina sp. 2201CG5-10]|uniref:hypothetical protein n=1 Tax=Aquimarina callyspongiae TaxID=3098150 RepID=UPI002AB3FA04|nr:hypothetical protein [Aquimarina sp. 2201CG5-10]MDY8134796.1 hypothetical protein [Aquimarina sp. 2201CG5-10]
MKRLFVLPLLALGLLAGTQNSNAQDVSSNDQTEITIQEKYIDLAVENLPQPVLDAVARDFKGSTISKAAAKEDASEFKLELTKEDGETIEVKCDAEGNWITK